MLPYAHKMPLDLHHVMNDGRGMMQVRAEAKQCTACVTYEAHEASGPQLLLACGDIGQVKGITFPDS